MDFYLDMSLTDKCDRGCSHCACNSRPDGANFLAFGQVEDLLKQIKRFDFRYVKLCISGGGEPLLHPDLVKIADMAFGALGKKLDLLIVTSGCLSEAEAEKEIIRELAKKYSRRLKFLLSFNLYNKTFPERLRTTLDLILRGGMIWAEIKLCFSLQNFAETYKRLYDALNDFGLYSGVDVRHLMVDVEDRFFRPEHYLSEIWSLRRMRQLTGLSLQSACLYILASRYGIMLLSVLPFSVHQRGRALNLKQCAWYLPGCRFLFKFPRRNVVNLFIDQRGRFLPDCDCITEPEMSLGEIGQISLAEVLRVKEDLGHYLIRAILADKRRFNDWDVCKICTWYKSQY